MVSVLVILDGAPEPVWPWSSTLEEAHMPALDVLCREGAVGRLATTPEGLEPGSETGIPALLGAPPDRQVGRGLVEAAAARIPVAEGHGAWRIDLHDITGARATAAEARLLVALLRAHLPAHHVTHLRGHRILAIGARRPAVQRVAALEARVWGDGDTPRAVLDERTVVVCAPGAAAGCAALMGARVVIPHGATGDVDTNLEAKTRAAVAALDDADTVVVHVGGADEAAHRRDRATKREFLELVDAEVIAPLAAVVPACGGVLAVTADHTTCAQTGRHGAEPVPLVLAGDGIAPAGPDRLHERLVAQAPVVASPWVPAEVAA
jgi:2,3-bisphosphoglycerate-independent phosphoglycerate mutase